MRKIFFIYVFLFLFLCGGRGLADEQGQAKATACEASFDMSTLPDYTPFIKTDLADLGDYFTCKAAIKEDIQICNIFPDNSLQKNNCQVAYNRYYTIFGKLFKNSQVSDEFLDRCRERSIPRNSCVLLGEVMLSGNADNCEKIEGLTPEDIATCKDMASSNPSQAGPFFVMALRKGDPAFCDQIPFSSDEPSSVRAICKGLLSKSVDGCQLNEGVSRFKKLYCQYLTGGTVDDTKKEE